MRYLSTLLLSFTIIFNFYAQNLDMDFGDNGISILDKYDDTGFELFSIPDGSGGVLLAGIPNQSFMNSGVYITKLSSDGNVDMDFGVDGYAEYDLGTGFVSMSDFLQLDNGNLVVSGTAFQNGWLIMFDAQGNLVTDFGDNGFFDTQNGADLNRVYITQVNDKIFALHKGSIDGTAYLATSYYNMDGTYDTDYGNNGTIVYDELQFGSFGGVSWDYSSNGEFNGVYFYAYRPNGEDVPFIGNVSVDGMINTDFGVGGIHRISGMDFIYTIAYGYDDQLLVVGRNNGDYVIQKFDEQGEMVSDFGEGGSYTDSWSFPISNIVGIAPLSDGGFLMGGTMDGTNVAKGVFQKHNVDGSVDEVVGEVIYDAQAVVALKFSHTDNGDIFLSGFISEEMNNPNRVCVLKYTSEITDVENIFTSKINVSPNPSSDASWTINDIDEEISNAYLRDISGRIALDLEIDQDHIYSQINVDSGLYILSLITDKGKLVNSKVVITE